jgi:uncharacterized membrane protein
LDNERVALVNARRHQGMHLSQLHYLPLTYPFFAILLGILLFLVVLIQVNALRYAYRRLGMSSGTAILLLFASLLGSYFNIPVAQLPQQQVVSGEEISFFGMHYVVPVVADWPGTVIAVNVGGALTPGLVSLYLLVKTRLFVQGALVVACVAFVCHLLAHPIRGVGIALPVFVPAVAAAVISLLVSRRNAAPLAYIGGSLGTLLGADLLNLDKLNGLGAPVASIGGAGTFDGVFLTGVLAVLLASLTTGFDEPRPVKP